MSRYCLRAALTGLCFLTAACSQDAGPPPDLSLATEIPQLAGCYGSVQLGAGPDSQAKRTDGPTLNFQSDGSGRYTVSRNGSVIGSAQFIPVGGVALYSAPNPEAQNKAGFRIALRSAERMRSFIENAYPDALQDPAYGSVQLTLLALQDNAIAGGDDSPGYGYYAYVYAWPGVMGVSHIDPYEPAVGEIARQHAVTISGTAQAPRVTADDENALFLFFRDWLASIDAAAGTGEVAAFARLQGGC